MDLKQLEYFAMVADERSFTRAAQRLNIVQSGLSASIRSLEDELGVPLLLRTTRRVDVTAAGEAFLIEARRVLAAADVARQVVAQMQGLQRGTLSIGIIQGLAPLIDIPGLLARFRAAHPDIEIRLISGGSHRLIEGVRTGALDLAFTQFVGATPSNITAWMLACEPLVLVCSRDHRLSNRVRLALGDLCEETFVDLQPDWGTRQLIDQSFAATRLRRRIGFEVNDPATQLELVAHNLGVALIPSAMIKTYPADHALRALCVVELAEPEICWELAVVFARNGAEQPVSVVTRTFLGFLHSAMSILEETDANDDAVKPEQGTGQAG